MIIQQSRTQRIKKVDNSIPVEMSEKVLKRTKLRDKLTKDNESKNAEIDQKNQRIAELEAELAKRNKT